MVISVPNGIDLSKIMGDNQNMGGKVSIIDEIIGVSQLLGACAWTAPKSTPMNVEVWTV